MSHQSTRLNCFSPPVMLATLTIESLLAIYTVWRYKLTALTRLVTVMLLGLATFQLAEYHVCTSHGEAIPWSRLGFVAITALPPLGLHILHVLAGQPRRRLMLAVYSVMAAFMGFFLLAPAVFSGYQCTGNYVIFQFSARITGVYSVYYYSLLATGIGLGYRWARQLKTVAKRQAVQGLVAGYLVFLVPVAVANTIKPQTRHGIPSIMCGFAVLLAVILVGYILPRVATSRRIA